MASVLTGTPAVFASQYGGVGGVGPTGPKGESGLAGGEGGTGPTGSAGGTGPTGSEGATGPTGAGSKGPLIQSGTASYSGPNTVVYFPTSFASPPQVFLQPTDADGTPDGTLYVQYSSFGGESLFTVTSTGSSSNMIFYWMAIGT